MMKLGIIGQQIAYSLSPDLHTIISAEAGLRLTDYHRFDISPDELEGTIQDLIRDGYNGVNVTIPYKQAVLPLANWRSEAVRLCGAANTLWFTNGEISAWNTDMTGMIHVLKSLNISSFRRSVIFGYGGVAPAVVYALKHSTIKDIYIAGRSPEKVKKFCTQHGLNPFRKSIFNKSSTLWINATPAGSVNHPEIPTAFHVSPRAEDFFLDLNYAPLPTHFQGYFEQKGIKTSDGLGLLIEQAVDSQAIWRKHASLRDSLNRENIRQKLLNKLDML
jgi:shikimate dehydrogenase